MDKREALAVLQEIENSCQKGWIITCISLDCPSSQISKAPKGEYQIKMKCKLDKRSRDCIAPILEKHKLIMREENGFVTLFSRQNA
jgi:hypothetical protein